MREFSLTVTVGERRPCQFLKPLLLASRIECCVSPGLICDGNMQERPAACPLKEKVTDASWVKAYGPTLKDGVFTYEPIADAAVSLSSIMTVHPALCGEKDGILEAVTYSGVKVFIKGAMDELMKVIRDRGPFYEINSGPDAWDELLEIIR